MRVVVIFFSSLFLLLCFVSVRLGLGTDGLINITGKTFITRIPVQMIWLISVFIN